MLFCCVFWFRGFSFSSHVAVSGVGREIFFSRFGLLMVIFCLFGWFGCSCFFFVLFRFVISAGNYYVPREMRVQFTRCFASRICEIFFCWNGISPFTLRDCFGLNFFCGGRREITI